MEFNVEVNIDSEKTRERIALNPKNKLISLKLIYFISTTILLFIDFSCSKGSADINDNMSLKNSVIPAEKSIDVHPPKTIAECHIRLDSMLSKEQKSFVKSQKTNDLLKFHFSLGMWIRNEWKLWSDNELSRFYKQKGIDSIDELSFLIIASYHRKLNYPNENLEDNINHTLKSLSVKSN